MSIKEGFYKVSQSGGTYVTATFFNPCTLEEYSKCVRDYDYADCSRDDDELYYMDIDKNAERAWKHHNGEILWGDEVKVVKGRKVPIGTIANDAELRDRMKEYNIQKVKNFDVSVVKKEMTDIYKEVFGE